jgi:peroxiredoxin
VLARKADYSKFQALNVQNLGISANNPFSQKTFANSLGLPYPVLSDYPDLRIIRQYGVLQHYLDPSRLAARRAFFLIDKQGIVRGRWLPEKQRLTFPNQPILERVREIAEKP